jgi:transcription elongation GreA/GreB family factor
LARDQAGVDELTKAFRRLLEGPVRQAEKLELLRTRTATEAFRDVRAHRPSRVGELRAQAEAIAFREMGQHSENTVSKLARRLQNLEPIVLFHVRRVRMASP